MFGARLRSDECTIVRGGPYNRSWNVSLRFDRTLYNSVSGLAVAVSDRIIVALPIFPISKYLLREFVSHDRYFLLL